MRKYLPVVVMVVAFSLAATLFVKARTGRTLTDADAARRSNQPIPVQVHDVDRGLLASRLPIEGVLEANPMIEIGTDLNNPVTQIGARVGSRVKKGQTLIQLDDRIERQELEKEQHRVEWLTKELKEQGFLLNYYKENREKGLSLEKDYRNAAIDWVRTSGDLDSATRSLKARIIDLKKTRITALADGVVTSIVQPGFAPKAGEALVSLAVVAPIVFATEITEEKLALARPGLDVDVSFYSYPGEVFRGKLTRIKPVANEEDRSVPVIIEIPNPDRKLMPGLHGIAQIKSDKHALRVPSVGLINPRFDSAEIFVVDDRNVVRLRRLRIGVYAEGFTEVIGGLEIGDQIVVAGQLGLHDGDRVRIKE